MKFKRSLLFILIVILSVVTIVSGCQSQSASKETEEGISPETEETSNETEEKKTLIVGTSASYYPWAFKKDDVFSSYEENDSSPGI